MFEKHKNHSIDIVILAVILNAALLTWALSRSYALVQEIDLSLPATSSAPVNRTDISANAISPTAETLQFEQMLSFHNQLTDTIKTFAKQEPNDYGIYVKHLSNGDIAATGETETFITASLYKPIVAMEVLRLVDQKQASLNEILPATENRTIKQCIADSITVSDNPCGRALRLRSQLGTEAGLRKLRDLGLSRTDLRGDYPVTTAKDIGIFYEQLYNGELLSKTSNKILLDAMLAQKINDRIPQGLPAGTKIAHKTGDLEGVAHDSGIVYSPSGDYLIVILSGIDSSGRNLEVRYSQMAKLSVAVHSIMLEAPQFSSDDAS